MKPLHSLLAVATISLAGAFNVRADVIIFDSFSDAPVGPFNSVPLSGSTPNTNLPGGSWVVNATGNTDQRSSNFFLAGPQKFGSPGAVPYLFLNFDRATISLAGSNSGELTISSYLAPTNSSGPLSLGFSPSAANTGGAYQLYGINLYNDGGVQLTLNGSTSATIAYTGGVFDPASTAYLLSFTIDTTTGAVTAISLSGSTSDYSSLLGGTSFSTTNTAFATVGSGFSGSYIDLSVTNAVPEPATATMLVLGGLGVILNFRRARHRILA